MSRDRDAARDRDEALALAPALRSHIREFETYEALLRKWQKSTNLVAAGTLPHLWTRHFADSAQILDAFPNIDAVSKIETWADLGAGAGFPGMVLAICLKDRPGARVHLIESDQRKVSFLRAVSRETGAAAEIHLGRIESILPSLEDRVVGVTARALAPLSQLVDWSRELLLKNAVGVFLKGEDWAAELTDSRAADSFDIRTFASRTHSSGRIIAIARDFGV
ncbi:MULTISPECIES: 16S rRNA (guanine(527)-N(7))-methyltransferase RsmG [Methylosinus]|uniref:Ribosomal RNA small subunit methyltransferase G n=1 Tax=Methylosinus trichosporium (strain ATCC 35070 / NCIMB 11131 / UNIQEM 75 / OB3b) TaxID=595536 RepID=A0A2D2D0Z2_METT3|nr:MULTISPECIES: 16S rRNA (guanine(527)-N(7))-methyltransferase RsmG [Methylosinus]ATQ68656.1 16S rRNA (guanine(527)-N(7))-methyltransferase RsmG [Methylosinus trichosporium OB3b]OBS53180.1 16S rRNA (guanine(527)-N(7))-methyltransferase RsmG [Methylosinus sp. 3S-1]